MIKIFEALTEFLKILNKLIDLLIHLVKDKFTTSKKILFIEEENKSIECLDFLKAIEKYNKSVIPYELINEYIIKREDLICKRKIYCKSTIDNFSIFEFDIVSSAWNDFNKNKYYCLDLNSSTHNKIQPQLKSRNSFAKKLSFSLNQAVNKRDDIKVELNYTNKGCLSDKRCYIIADTKYKRLNLNKYTVIIRSKNSKVDNIRIYLVENDKTKYMFLEKIFPIDEKNEFYRPDYTTFVHYIDIKLIKNNISLIYYFDK